MALTISRLVIVFFVFCCTFQFIVGQSTETAVTDAITTEQNGKEEIQCDSHTSKPTKKAATIASAHKMISQRLSNHHLESEWFPVPKSKILNYRRYKSSYYSKLAPSLLENKSRNGFVPSISYLKLLENHHNGINPRKNFGNVRNNDSELTTMVTEERSEHEGNTNPNANVLKAKFTLTVHRLRDHSLTTNEEKSIPTTEETETPSPTSFADTTTTTVLETTESTEEMPTTQGNTTEEEQQTVKVENKNSLLLRDNVKLARGYDRRSKQKEKQVFKFTELKLTPENSEEENGSKGHKYSQYLLVRVRNKRNVPSSVEDEAEDDLADVLQENDEDSTKKVSKDFGNISSEILEEVLKRGIQSYLQSNVPFKKNRKSEKNSKSLVAVDKENESPLSKVKPALPFDNFSGNVNTDKENDESGEHAEDISIQKNSEEEKNRYLRTFFNPLESKDRPVFDEPPQKFEVISPHQSPRTRNARNFKRIPKRSDIRNGAYISVIDSPNLKRERISDGYKTENEGSASEENGIWKQSMRNFARGKGSNSRPNKIFANIQDSSEELTATRISSSSASQQQNQETSSSTNRAQFASTTQSKPWSPSSTGRGKTRRSGTATRSSSSQSNGNFPANFGSSYTKNGLRSANSANRVGGPVPSLDLAQLLLQDNPYETLTSSKSGFQQQGVLSNADLLSLAANSGATVAGAPGIVSADLAALLRANNPSANTNPSGLDLASLLRTSSAAILRGGDATSQTPAIGGLPSTAAAVDLAALLSGSSGTAPGISQPWNPWAVQQASKKIGQSTPSGPQGPDSRTLSLLQNLFTGNTGSTGSASSSAATKTPSGASANITSNAWPWSTTSGASNPWQNQWPAMWPMPTTPQMMMMMGMGGGD